MKTINHFIKKFVGQLIITPKIELSPLKTNAKRFDWNIMAPIYDDFFYDLI